MSKGRVFERVARYALILLASLAVAFLVVILAEMAGVNLGPPLAE